MCQTRQGGGGGIGKVGKVWHEQKSFVADGSIDDFSAMEGFEGNLGAASGKSAVTGEWPGGSFPQTGPDMIGVELGEEDFGHFGEKAFLVFNSAQSGAELVEILYSCRGNVEHLQWWPFCLAAVNTGYDGFSGHEGVAEIDGLFLGLHAELVVEVNLHGEIGDADDVALMQGQIGYEATVDKGSVGRVEVLDGPVAVRMLEHDGVLAGDGAIR